MIDLTDHLRPHARGMDDYFKIAALEALAGKHSYQLSLARQLYADHRVGHGFEHLPAPILTWPNHNRKLKKGEIPSYGLTLQHTTTRIRPRLIVNACPHAGDCQKVCVLNTGHGYRDNVIRGRRSKTVFLATQPRAFSYLLGYELGKALGRHLAIRWRPNVNSDVRWEELIPSAFDGSALGGHAYAYDYTKDADRVLGTNGWIRPFYRLSYSWNENSPASPVVDFLERGGSVAVVTSRRRGQPIVDGGYYRLGPYGVIKRGVDADLTDDWMFEEGVIGDLSAKARARSLIGKSGFVVGDIGGTA